MSESTNSMAAAAVNYQVLGGSGFATAGGATVVAVMAAVVVMLMTPPRNKREWASGLISTVVASIGGGAAAVQCWGLQSWAQSAIGMVALGGLIFACGLPGWAVVRWAFNYINAHRDASITEVARDVKGLVP